MRPSSRQIIESIQWEIDTRIGPEVQSDWARSSLRSIAALLSHLAARVDVEAELLVADNADLRAVLTHVGPLLGVPESAVPAESGPPVLADLVGENEALRDLVDKALDTALERGPEDAVAELLACLRRQLERERPLVVPAFTGPLF